MYRKKAPVPRSFFYAPSRENHYVAPSFNTPNYAKKGFSPKLGHHRHRVPRLAIVEPCR